MRTRRQFLTDSAFTSAGMLLSSSPNALAFGEDLNQKPNRTQRPNIVLILADDMGFSDIGCYGSEIDTPNLDGLAANGLQFKQFYNNPRCCPSRASLMTGLYPHQVGMGLMVSDHGRYPYPAYAGDLSSNCVTIAEAMRSGGYRTAMVGKWHLTPPVGMTKHNWPLQRGFEKYYGTIAGAATYYDPQTLTRDNTPIRAKGNYYYTDELGKNAGQFIDDFAGGESPFFLYVAFTAPHWPMHALEEDIVKYKERYRAGWDVLRKDRHAKQISMGLVDAKWGLTARDSRVPDWEIALYKDWEMHRMAVYAAMVDRLDQNVGRIVNKLKERGIFDNTLIFFMSDNGGNFEEIGNQIHSRPIFMPFETADGMPVHAGNRPSIKPGSANTYQSYGIPWGNCSNTPFRLYKHYCQEGGISTPLIAHWPSGIKVKSQLSNEIGHETDIMATCLDVANISYPSQSKSGQTPPPLVGESLLPIFQHGTRPPRSPIYWEHEGNSAMRDGRWKLVSRFPDEWELYDMVEDRTEEHDLADQRPQQVESMAKSWLAWAKYVGVQPWPMPQTPAGARDGAMPSPKYLLDQKYALKSS